MDAGTAEGASLPSALVDEPGGGNLHVRFIDVVVGNMVVLTGDVFVEAALHDWVHEKAPGIALDSGVGQLLATDADSLLSLLQSLCHKKESLTFLKDLLQWFFHMPHIHGLLLSPYYSFIKPPQYSLFLLFLSFP